MKAKVVKYKAKPRYKSYAEALAVVLKREREVFKALSK
jgi:hypothetical protein